MINITLERPLLFRFMYTTLFIYNCGDIVQVTHSCRQLFLTNKTRYMLVYLNSLVNDIKNCLTELRLHYSIRSHSRIPCDRDFGRIEKNKLKMT